VVIDTSILLSIYFNQAHAAWAADQLNAHAGELRMSTVNLAEALIRIRDRQPRLADQLESKLLSSGIEFVAPDVDQARIAAAARLRFPLNLGDCFAYALAKPTRDTILTLDKDFRAVDCPVLSP